jgi:hypothetical protein
MSTPETKIPVDERLFGRAARLYLLRPVDQSPLQRLRFRALLFPGRCPSSRSLPFVSLEDSQVGSRLLPVFGTLIRFVPDVRSSVLQGQVPFPGLDSLLRILSVRSVRHSLFRGRPHRSSSRCPHIAARLLYSTPCRHAALHAVGQGLRQLSPSLSTPSCRWAFFRRPPAAQGRCQLFFRVR